MGRGRNKPRRGRHKRIGARLGTQWDNSRGARSKDEPDYGNADSGESGARTNKPSQLWAPGLKSINRREETLARMLLKGSTGKHKPKWERAVSAQLLTMDHMATSSLPKGPHPSQKGPHPCQKEPHPSQKERHPCLKEPHSSLKEPHPQKGISKNSGECLRPNTTAQETMSTKPLAIPFPVSLDARNRLAYFA